MLKLNSFLNECCFKGCSMGLKVGSLDSPVHRTPGSLDSPVLRTILDFQRVKFCNSPVHRTPGSFDSQSTEES